MNNEDKEKHGLTIQTEEAEEANINPFPLFFLKNQKRWWTGKTPSKSEANGVRLLGNKEKKIKSSIEGWSGNANSGKTEKQKSKLKTDYLEEEKKKTKG